MLDAPEFLDRVIAPGNYLAFAFKDPEWRHMAHRFFPRDQIEQAVGWLRYMGHRLDVWCALASFKEAIPNGEDQRGPKFKGSRRQNNADQLQCLWFDADIKRDGDNKKPEDVYADNDDVIRWLGEAKRKTGLLVPNLWIKSGYGVHLYWIMDQAISVAEWMPLAAAFKRLLVASGARGDIGVSGDCVRIMRPPETFNHKIIDDPKQCYDMTDERVAARVPAAYPLSTIRALLGNPHTVTEKVAPLGGLPPGLQIRENNLGAAAKAGLSRAPHDFALIAQRCGQVARSLAEGGEHDGRQLWHRMVNLAFFCGDRTWAHRIGEKHKDYSVEDTDAKWDQTEDEHKHKDFGAPFCQAFHTERSDICPTCPHFEKIASPYSLGVADVQVSGLPANYRRNNGWIEHWVKDDWIALIEGDFNKPQLLFNTGAGHQLRFEYTVVGRHCSVVIDVASLGTRVDGIRSYLEPKGITLSRFNAVAFGDFIMAWIDELRRACTVADAPPAFGYSVDREGGYAGTSVGGTFYAVDGTEGPAQLGDPKIYENYQPRGSLERWQEAANFVLEGRPDLQAVTAVAFAAPLMEFVGESAVLSVWSQHSGARKTSAFRIGSSVWCNPITGMSAIRDTTNSVQASLTMTRIMPVYWDEIHVHVKDQIAKRDMVELFFNLTQGRGRARLDHNMAQRDPGHWRTMMIVSSNKPMSELIEQDRGAGTDAGVIRIFEFEVESQGKTIPEASAIVQLVERNYGSAGRIYIAWVARHIERIKQIIELIKQRIFKDAEWIDASERYHAAAITALVAGATFAKHIGLFAFDVDGMYKFLIDSLKGQRKERHEDLTPRDRPAFLLKVFEQFVADQAGYTLVHQSFASRGRPRVGLPDRGPKLIQQPSPRAVRAFVHVGINDMEMRIDHNVLKDWCVNNDYSYKSITSGLQNLWGAERVRDILARNTNWSSGSQVSLFKINLNIAQLRKYVYAWGAPTRDDDGNVVQFPGDPD